ncbi:MAG: HigA family addiction module antitoxin [Acidobacteriota bacterium]
MANKRQLDPIHPGEILSEEFMKPLGISINKLARDIGVAPGKISAILKGKRSITADTALRLAKYFRVSSEVWLGLQADYDLRVARRLIGPEIEKQVHAYVA